MMKFIGRYWKLFVALALLAFAVFLFVDTYQTEKLAYETEMNACLPGCVWNATPRSLSPLERNIGFWTQA